MVSKSKEEPKEKTDKKGQEKGGSNKEQENNIELPKSDVKTNYDGFEYRMKEYIAGNIVANNLADGIVGTLADETGVVYGSVENSYYLNTSVTNGINIGTPKTIKEMKTREFAKLLGIPTWKYVEVKNNNYPVLSWQ